MGLETMSLELGGELETTSELTIKVIRKDDEDASEEEKLEDNKEK